MLERFMIKGAQDACAYLKLANAEVSMLGHPVSLPPSPAAAAGASLGARAGGFLRGQVDAGKDLFSNLRGGLGGKLNPDVMPAPGGDMGMARAAHRARAVGNLKTLAPTLLAGGGLYAMHRHNQQQDQQQQQQAMMQGGYGQPMM